MKDENQITRTLLDYADRKNLYIDYYPSCAEPGYNEGPVLAADWNPPKMKRLGDYIEKMETVNLEWSDEWAGCQDCGAAVRTSPSSYGWTPYYVVFNDCELVCLDCAKQDAEAIIDEYKNKDQKAIVPDLNGVIERAGFICYSPDEYCQRFETGFHPGQNDWPADVAKDIEENLPDYDYIFKIDGVGQFDVAWSVFIRRREDD